MIPYCDCAEIKDSKGNEYKRVPEWHDCDYIKKRNKLIKEAYAYAEENSRDPYQFTQVFSTKMDQLAIERKLV